MILHKIEHSFEYFRLQTLVDMAPEGKKARIYMLGDFIKGRVKAIVDPYDVSDTIVIT